MEEIKKKYCAIIGRFKSMEENTEDVVNKCLICGIGNGALCSGLCSGCCLKTKNYNWLKEYLNRLDKVSKDVVYIIEFATAERLSYIINDVVVNNNGTIGYSEKGLSSKKVEHIEKNLAEMVELRKAREIVVNMLG